MIDLIVEAGPQSGQRFVVDSATVLGRGQFADLMISDLAVSRRHAQIDNEGGSWKLRDLESANGTRHNGRLVMAPIAIEDGDTIELGQTRLRVRWRDPARLPAAPVESTMLEPVALPPLPGVKSPTPPPARAVISDVHIPRTSAANELYQTTIARLKALSHVGDMLSEAGSLESRLRDVLSALSEAFPRCERFAILVREATHRPWRVLAQRCNAPLVLDEELATAVGAAAITQGHPIIATNSATLPAIVPAHLLSRLPAALAAAPIRSAGLVLGALYLDSDEESLALRAADREFLSGAAGHLGAVLSSYRHAESEQLIHPQDIDLARRIQQRFLPSATPRIDGYELADSYTAARIVGGDLFDFLTLADGRPALLIGDVSGKGFPAALYMARLGAHARALAPRCKTPAELLSQMNQLLRTELEGGMFATCLVAALDAPRGVVRISSGGHPPPIVRRANGQLESLPIPVAPALGINPTNQFHEVALELARGDGLLLYTDGLDDALSSAGEVFGTERVRETLKSTRSAGQAIEALLTAIGSFLGDVTQYDDLTLIALWRR
jgi:sigma-B regulation protein RsbU (phosphoserine phosphatase)